MLVCYLLLHLNSVDVQWNWAANEMLVFPIYYCLVFVLLLRARKHSPRLNILNAQLLERMSSLSKRQNFPVLFFLKTLQFVLSSGDLQTCFTETLRFTCITKQVFQLWCSKLLLMWKHLQKAWFSMVASSSFWKTIPLEMFLSLLRVLVSSQQGHNRSISRVSHFSGCF